MEATAHLDLDALEASDKPFDTITKLLDGLYQYEELVEVPTRCEEFFQEFSRNKGEDMQSYLVRHMTMMKRMKEIKVEIPGRLAPSDTCRGAEVDTCAGEEHVWW